MLASRTGKTETEILVEEVKAEKPKVSAAEWQPLRACRKAVAGWQTTEGCTPLTAARPCRCRQHLDPPLCCSLPARLLSCLPAPQLRLNAQQLDEKRAAESAVEEIRELLDAATSEESKDQLGEELKARQSKLDDLLAGFEVRAVCVWLWGG